MLPVDISPFDLCLAESHVESRLLKTYIVMMSDVWMSCVRVFFDSGDEAPLPDSLVCRIVRIYQKVGTARLARLQHEVKLEPSCHDAVQSGVLIETLRALSATVQWASCEAFSTQGLEATNIAKAGTGFRTKRSWGVSSRSRA